MKKLIILLFPITCYCKPQRLPKTIYPSLDTTIIIWQRDTTPVKQDTFFSPLLNKYVLMTNMGSMYDNVIHGTIQYILQQKPIEYAAALRRKKPVAIVTIKCKQ